MRQASGIALHKRIDLLPLTDVFWPADGRISAGP